MFPDDVTAADLGIYIRDNIENASMSEADEMIEWLFIYQVEAENYFNSKIWEDEYMDVFREDMDSIFTVSKIDNIEDEVVKNDFVNLVNSFLIIDDYFDYPVIRTDWDELAQYTSYLSDDFRIFIEFNKKIENYEYDHGDLDVAGFSKDIVIIEGISKNTQSPFIRWKSNDLWQSLVTTLLLGPEGSYLYNYIDKDCREYQSLMEIKSKYPASILAEIMEEIELIPEIEDINQIVDIIWRRLEFGINSDSYFEIVKNNHQNGEYELLEIRIPSNLKMENHIANIIKLDTEQYIKEMTNDNTFELQINPNFQNDRYISYSGFLRVTDSNEETEFFNFSRNLDYVEGEVITLEDYFDADFNFIQGYLEEETGVKIETLPEFELTSTGVDITVEIDEDTREYIYLDHKNLLKYFTLGKFLFGN